MPVGQKQIPTDLQAILHELARSEREAHETFGSLSDAHLNWQPREAATWSIAQCVDHLARVNTIYAAAMSDAVRAKNSLKVPWRGEILPGFFSRFFIRTMDAPPRRKFSAPAQAVPSAQISGAEALKSFVSSHDKVRALIHESEGMDLNRIRFKNPFVPLLRWTVGTGLLVILAHDRRHLWQVNQVRSTLSINSHATKASAEAI